MCDLMLFPHCGKNDCARVGGGLVSPLMVVITSAETSPAATRLRHKPPQIEVHRKPMLNDGHEV
jgi:hypothetical protein